MSEMDYPSDPLNRADVRPEDGEQDVPQDPDSLVESDVDLPDEDDWENIP